MISTRTIKKLIKNIPNRCLQAARRVRLYCRSTTRAILRKPQVKYFFYRVKKVCQELVKKTKLVLKQTRLYKVYWELIKKTKLALKQTLLYKVYWELVKKTKLVLKQTRLYKVYWELVKKTKLAAKRAGYILFLKSGHFTTTLAAGTNTKI